VSIEASFGVSTGISASDRAHTVRVASNPEAKPSDIHMPGHIFPIKAQPGGVLKRAGHTEGSVDLAKLAGLNPAAVICEVMNDDGSMARVPNLIEFAKKHQLKIGTIVDLIEYRLAHESLVEELIEKESLESQLMDSKLKMRIFRSKVDGIEHLVLQKGEIQKDQPTLVRVHVDSYLKEAFSLIQKGESTLAQSLKILDREGSGVLVLLRGNNKTQNLRGEIEHVIQSSQAGGSHTSANHAAQSMDQRDYGIGAQIIRALGIHKVKLLSNKPEKRIGLKAYGIEIVETVPLK
jgi:3,4-dihydroxy 2-butanone 4-phosphate synthase/GTP cyclohydrolase II